MFRIGHLGDTLVALPAFSALRKSFPLARISLLTNTSAYNPHLVEAQSVLPVEGLFDEYIRYPADAAGSLAVFIKLLFQLRRRRFDAVVYLMTRNRLPKQIRRDLRFFRLAGITQSYGVGHLFDNLLDFGAERPLPKVCSEADFLMDCLERDGLAESGDNKIESAGVFEERDMTAAERWLAGTLHETLRSEKLIAVAPGSKWDSKVWDEDRYAWVVAQLIEKEGVFPIIFGGSEDAEKGDRLISRWGTGANAAGRLSVKESAAALSRCLFYLGNDTGAMHLAAASGTRCVAVFAAVDFDGRWHPVGSGHSVFRSSVPCEGCSSPNCANERLCLEMVQKDEVLEACLGILRGGSARAS